MGYCAGCGQEFFVFEVLDPQEFVLAVTEPFAKLCCARYTPNGHDIEIGWCVLCCPSKEIHHVKPPRKIRRWWWRVTDMLSNRYPWKGEKGQPDED